MFVILAIRDRQLGAFMQPAAFQSIGQGIRSFRDETNNRESPLNKHPEDYDLYHCGNWDEKNGKIEAFPEPTQIAIGSNLIERKPAS